MAAVTFAMKALCFAANSGLLSLEDLLPRTPSLKSEAGGSSPGCDPAGVEGAVEQVLFACLVSDFSFEGVVPPAILR